jgi:hypothetical protein
MKRRRKTIFWGIVLVVLGAILLSSWLRPNSSTGTANGPGSGGGNQPATPANTATPVPKISPAPGGQAFILFTPGVVAQGGHVNVLGSNFDPKSRINFLIKQKEADPGRQIAYVQTDATGSFTGVNITLPDSQPFGAFIVQAREANSALTAETMGVVQNGGAATVKLTPQVGKIGQVITVTAKGFAPSEQVNVYWGSLGTDPVATLQADTGGGMGQQPLQVPFGAIGANTFIFEGAKSQTPIVVAFYLLNIYPVVTLSNYAIRADNVLNYTGKDFGPKELVAVYLDKPEGQPIATVQTDGKGAFVNATGFNIPFTLKGKQTLYFLGSLSRAQTTVAFTVEPYAPSAKPSTYACSPGTSVSFYVAGFARSETVNIATGATQDNPGKIVGTFTTDDKGAARAVGSYDIPPDVQPGKLIFILTGTKSGAVATVTVQISAP